MIRFQSIKLGFLAIALTLGAGCEYYGQIPQEVTLAEGSIKSGEASTTDEAGADDVFVEKIESTVEAGDDTVTPPNAPASLPTPTADAPLTLEWGAAARLDVNSDTKAKQPEVAASANGDVIATWKHGLEMVIGSKSARRPALGKRRVRSTAPRILFRFRTSSFPSSPLTMKA